LKSRPKNQFLSIPIGKDVVADFHLCTESESVFVYGEQGVWLRIHKTIQTNYINLYNF